MNLFDTLLKYSVEIKHQWAHRLNSEVSEHFSNRPLEELTITTSEAADANFAIIINNDFSKIDAFIEKQAKARLEAGFPLSDLQKAFELYRIMLLPILVRELKGSALLNALQNVDDCLSYTIHKFSDYFQSLHEKEMENYARNLERKIENRTKELVRSEAKYRVLVEDINDGYFVNQNGIIVFANSTFCEMHGYTLPEVIGRPYTDFISTKSLAQMKMIFKERIRERKKGDLYVYYRLHKNGQSFPTENKVKLILYQDKKAAAGICRDITDRMEIEKRIRESERLAHIGQLTTSLAHEIRNPLSSVKMNIQILLKKLQLNGNDKRRMEIMAYEISNLERILEEMLDFAKPISLNLKDASINEIVNSCLEIMDAKIKERNILIKTKLSEDIPRIEMDSEKMEQAIINVILNSIDALPESGEIEIRTRHIMKDGGMLKVQINDSGPGMKDEELAFIFNPFFSMKKKGTGLGLTNVKKIVEAHGGVVKATTRYSKGMCINFMIPLMRQKNE